MGWNDTRPLMGRESYILREDAEVLDEPDGYYKIVCPDCGDSWRQTHLQRFYNCATCRYKWRSH